MKNLILFFRAVLLSLSLSLSLSLVACESVEQNSLKKELKEQKKLAEAEFKKTYKKDSAFRPDSLFIGVFDFKLQIQEAWTALAVAQTHNSIIKFMKKFHNNNRFIPNIKLTQ